MCGGWACASYAIACNHHRLSPMRFTGRCFAPTPCGPYDSCSPCCGGGCCGGGCPGGCGY
ncbi:male-specific sperm protein Mst84Db [Drosophila sulfurigaster albostrigata]|uniref:male-specific sperm protein Mst84Db n=1 Tax=Drosophila sulfurigaster albostrigata TaxID=89887 RepID=UPI002D21A000|nr:male-specific sperm protein Mst84Db [Drosophila sulfurigaster albostrigata]